MQCIIVRTLFSEIRVWPGDEAAAKSFAFVRAAPIGGGRVGEPTDIAIEPLGPSFGPFYRMVLPDRPHTEGSLEYLLSEFQRFLGARLEQEAGRYPVLHAASVVRETIRGLIIGSKGSGKTTLILKLMMEGFSVEGDEHVMIRGQTVLARPRTLRVKQTTLPLLLPLLGPLADTVAASPWSENWYGRVIYSVEPCGAPWRIEEGPTKLLIFIEPNHDGTSILTPMRREEAFNRLLEMSYFPDGAPGAAVAALRMAAIGAKCLKLKLGDLERAVWHLCRAFSDARIKATSGVDVAG